MYEAVYIHDLSSVLGLYNAYNKATEQGGLGSSLPFDPFVRDPAGRTYLHICGSDPQHKVKPLVDVDCARILNALLSFGIDGSHRCNSGWSPLDVYSAQGYPEVVQVLVKHPTVKLDSKDVKYGMTALMRAAINGHWKVAEIILEGGADPDSVSWGGFTALMYATRNEVLKFRGEEHGKDKKGYSNAVVEGGGGGGEVAVTAVEEVGVGEGAGVSSDDDGCSDSSDPNCVNFGISPGNEYFDVISVLLKYGCDVNVPDDRGMTAIMVAASGGHEQLVKLLLEGGKVDMKRTDNEGLGAISYSRNDAVRGMLVDYLDAKIKANGGAL
jgi:ankyrin repeat protein